jgi:hypothetical protein
MFMKRGSKGKNKKGIITEYLPWIIIAILVLVIVVVAIAMFKEKGFTFIDKIKNLFRRS